MAASREAIRQAFQDPKSKEWDSWDDLSHWLEHRPEGREFAEASQRAQSAGEPFPKDPNQAERVLEQYRGQSA